MSKISVYIEGDKNLFKTKTGVDKFKIFVRGNNDYNLEELSTKYLNENNRFELVNKTESDIKFKIIEKQVEPEVKNDDKKEQLRNKLKDMKRHRTNSSYLKTKNYDDNVNDILKEYNKVNMMTKGQLPDPSEILREPEKYKHMIAMMLCNPMIKKMGKNHPFSKFYTLLAAKLGVTEKDGLEAMKLMNQMNNLQNPDIKTMIANKTNNDDDTESEDEETPKLVASTNDEDTEDEDD